MLSAPAICAAVGRALLGSPKRLECDASAAPALWGLRDGFGARHSKLARRAYPDPAAYAVVVADDLSSIKALNNVLNNVPFAHHVASPSAMMRVWWASAPGGGNDPCGSW